MLAFCKHIGNIFLLIYWIIWCEIKRVWVWISLCQIDYQNGQNSFFEQPMDMSTCGDMTKISDCKKFDLVQFCAVQYFYYSIPTGSVSLQIMSLMRISWYQYVWKAHRKSTYCTWGFKQRAGQPRVFWLRQDISFTIYHKDLLFYF